MKEKSSILPEQGYKWKFSITQGSIEKVRALGK